MPDPIIIARAQAGRFLRLLERLAEQAEKAERQ